MATSGWISSTASSSSKLNRTKSPPSKSRCSLRRMAHAGLDTPSPLCVARNIRSQAAHAAEKVTQVHQRHEWLCLLALLDARVRGRSANVHAKGPICEALQQEQGGRE